MLKSNNNFDMLRLSLAFFVFLAHWNGLTSQGITNSLFHLGHLSVDMFFVISGFLIFWSFDKNTDKKEFYIRRFFRIFPLYFIVISIQTIFFIIYSSGDVWQISKYFISNIFFLNFLSPSVSDIFSNFRVDAINGSLWTLKNEVLFYFLVPYIYLVIKKYGDKALYLMYLLSLIYVFFVSYSGYEHLLTQFPSQLRLFLVGVFFYINFSKLKINNLVLIAFFSMFSIFLFKDYSFFYYLIYPFCIGFVVMFLAYATKLVRLKFDFSYSLYIVHFPVIQLFIYFGVFSDNAFYSFLMIFVFVFVLSLISEKYIEKKFVKIGKVFLENKSLRL